jgi:hypothetical protein
MERQMTEQIKPAEPVAIPLVRAHELVGCSRTQFAKIWVESGLIQPVDLGGRGRSVILAELQAAIKKRTEAIRSGEIVPPIRSARGRRTAQPTAAA